VALYGLDLLLAAVAYFLLVQALLPLHGAESTLAGALGSGVKERISLGLYVLAVVLAFVLAPAACALYVLVAAMWLAPDPRIERRMTT
jgi:hypothetical protein